jgi:hypothetical protein
MTAYKTIRTHFGTLATFVMLLLLLPQVSQAFFPIIIPIPRNSGGSPVQEVTVANPNFSFSYTQDSFEFKEIQTHAEALAIYNLLLTDPTVTEADPLLIIGPTAGYHLRLSGLTAAQRTAVTPYFDAAQSITVSSYVNGMGVLRYRVQILLEIEAPSGGFALSLYSSQVLAFENQPFSLRWAIAYTNPVTCTLRSAGPTSVSLPSGNLLTTYGSTTVRIATAGDYTFTYDCISNGVRQVRSVMVSIVPTDVPFDASVSGAICAIGPNESSCEGYISWDSYVQNGTIESVILRNVTTQTIITTDPRGLNHPVQLRYGTSTFLLELVVRDRLGQSSRTTASAVGTTACAAGTTWNGTVCVPTTTAGAWDIISDFDSYGAGYSGMPARRGGNMQHPENTMCQSVRFWACDVRDWQPPVQVEIFIDNELVHTDRTNIHTPVEHYVDPWWEGMSRYHYSPACGMSDHLTVRYQYSIPERLKDNQVHNLKIKATRADGVSRWVTFNGWNAFSNYPNTEYQNFPFQCSPTQVNQVTDLAGYLAFPSAATSGVPIIVTEARVVNEGTLDLATSTRAVLQFDFDGNGYGGPNDFSVSADIVTLASGETVYPNFNQVSFPVAGNWRVRLSVDPGRLVDPDTMRGNNLSRWLAVTVTAGATSPSATLSATNCVIPVGQSTCQSTVSWSSINFNGTTEVLQGTTVLSTTRSNLSGITADVSIGNRSFTIRDTGSSYSQTIMPRVECDGVSNWVDGVCVLGDGLTPPQVSLDIDRRTIRSGETATLQVTIAADYPVTCEVLGLGRSPETITHVPSVPTTETVTTSPLFSKQKIQISCAALGFPEVTKSVDVEVVPVQFEI